MEEGDQPNFGVGRSDNPELGVLPHVVRALLLTAAGVSNTDFPLQSRKTIVGVLYGWQDNSALRSWRSRHPAGGTRFDVALT